MIRVRQSIAGLGLGGFFALVVTVPAWAQAQPPRGPAPARGPRANLTVQAAWIGPVSFGRSSEVLLRPDGSELVMFNADSRQGHGLGVEVHLGVPMGRQLEVEAGGTWSRGPVESRISSDFEAAEPVTVSETLQRVTVEGALVWAFRTRGRTSYFVRGAVGWMRELVAEGALVEDASVANFGAGVKYWWRERPRGAVRRMGWRIEGRASVRTSGITLGDSSIRVAPVVCGGIIFGF